MSNLTTTEDLVQDALRKAGEKIDGTSDFQADALTYMNDHYQKILSGGNYLDVDLGDPWPWAKSKYPGVLTLEPAYTSDAVVLTEDSLNASFTVAPANSQAGKYLKLDNTFEVYRIATHTAGNVAFTLDSPFNDLSGTFAYQAIKLDYDLGAANILRLFAPLKVCRVQTYESDFEYKVTALDIKNFDRKYPIVRVPAGIPTEFCEFYAADGLLSIRLNKYVMTKSRCEYDFIPVPAALTYDSSSIPIIPAGHRQVLSLATAYSLNLDKEDDKSDHYLKVTQAAMKAMKSAFNREASQTGKNVGRLITRADDYRIRTYPVTGDN